MNNGRQMKSKISLLNCAQETKVEMTRSPILKSQVALSYCKWSRCRKRWKSNKRFLKQDYMRSMNTNAKSPICSRFWTNVKGETWTWQMSCKSIRINSSKRIWSQDSHKMIWRSWWPISQKWRKAKKSLKEIWSRRFRSFKRKSLVLRWTNGFRLLVDRLIWIR